MAGELLLYLPIAVAEVIFFLSTRDRIKKYASFFPALTDIEFIQGAEGAKKPQAASPLPAPASVDADMSGDEDDDHDIFGYDDVPEEAPADENPSEEEAADEEPQTPVRTESEWPIYFRRTNEFEEKPEFDVVLEKLNHFMNTAKAYIHEPSFIPNLVKNETEQLIESVNHSLPFPLYVGLMGTMFGIVYALFSMQLDKEVTIATLGSIVTGVKYAMGGSLVGLLLMLINSQFVKTAMEAFEAKNWEFCKFARTQITQTPELNMGGDFSTLHQNLMEFNSSFSENITIFKLGMAQNAKTIKTQASMLKEMANVDVAQVARVNLKMFKDMQQAFSQMEKFTDYIAGLNKLMEKSEEASQHMINFVGRTEDIRAVLARIEDQYSMNYKLVSYITTEIERIRSGGNQYVGTLTGIEAGYLTHMESLREKINEQSLTVYDAIERSIKEMHNVVEAQVSKIRSISIDTESLLTRNVEDTRVGFHHLRHLETIKNNFDHMGISMTNNTQVLRSLVELAERDSEQIVAMTRAIQSLKKESWILRIKRFVKRKSKAAEYEK